jgi:predicted transcriptional regulator
VNSMDRAAYEAAQARVLLVEGLTRRRIELGLTQGQLALRMKVGQSTVSQFESLDNDPRLSTMQRYAHAVEAKLIWKVLANEE